MIFMIFFLHVIKENMKENIMENIMNIIKDIIRILKFFSFINNNFINNFMKKVLYH